MKKLVLGCVAALLCVSATHAEVVLLAQGELTRSRAGAYADLSGLKGNLENGQPANQLGGLGSGLAWAGGTTFLAVPDRGPNATNYNAKVDNTVSWINRFHTLSLALVPSTSGELPFVLKPVLTGTTCSTARRP
ncbi:MAG: hypothetical protein WDN45_01255 [Caulobacteraceae bacterium]